MDTLHANVHSKNTAALIDVNPMMVRLQRHKKETLADGGFKLVSDALIAEQRCSKVDASAQSTRALPDGKVITVTGVLVFMLGADVMEGDSFKLGDDTWYVAFVHSPPWSVRAEVGRYASA